MAANVRVFRQMIATATWNTDRMASSCEGGFSGATDLAEYLVKKGLLSLSAAAHSGVAGTHEASFVAMVAARKAARNTLRRQVVQTG